MQTRGDDARCGRIRGPGPGALPGLSTEIRLLSASRCRPLARVTTAGQRHDSLAFQRLMDRLRIARLGPAGPEPDPTGCSRTRRTPTAKSAPTCATRDQGHHPGQERATSKPPARPRAPPVAAHQRSTLRNTQTATPPNAPSPAQTVPRRGHPQRFQDYLRVLASPGHHLSKCRRTAPELLQSVTITTRFGYGNILNRVASGLWSYVCVLRLVA